MLSRLAAPYLFLIGLILLPSQMAAQVPVELGGYAGMAVPTGDWKSEDGAKTGWGYGVGITVRPLSFVGLYGGWDRFRFGVDETEAGSETDVTFIDSGLRAGVELKLPLPYAAPFVSGGVVLAESEMELEEGSTTSRFRTGSDIGFEANAGVDVDVGPVRIRPRVGYRGRDAEFGSFFGGIERREIRVTYLVYTIGVTLIP